MKEYKIGSFKPKNRVFLAPMLEPNDIAFRMLCHESGSGVNFTGMEHPLSKKKIYLDDKPFLQIFCTTEKGIKEFFKKYEDEVSGFDLNLGCPSPLAGRFGFGSFLQKNTLAVEKILKEMRESTKKPLVLKLRKSDQAIKIAQKAEQIGFDGIIIHPRTKDQGYAGIPDEKFALELKSLLKIPVIYSGNVNLNNYKEFLKKFDFVMIGREAIGRPNVFAKISKTKKELNFLDYLVLAKKYEIRFNQVKWQAMAFTKGMKNAKVIREKLIYVKTLEELEKLWKANMN
jgi:tRNA-dihydrouridine synthase B